MFESSENPNILKGISYDQDIVNKSASADLVKMDRITGWN